MNRRSLLSTLLTTVVGSALPVHAQSGKLRGYRARQKTKSKSVIGKTIEARDEHEAVAKLQKRYPDSTILNLKPDRSDLQRQRKPAQ